jgi:NAD(P)-dependent dehydrogenase (short-subunit alcohol dehydrogenase family)
MSNAIVLVTGANKGIGKEIARQLGKQGHTVIIGARDEAAGAAAVRELVADGVAAVAVRLDVTRPADIDAAAAFITTKYGKLDVLVNNAGIALDWDGTPMTADKMRRTYEANVIGPWQVTEAMLPLLEKSADARVINHSSILGSITLAETAWAQMGTMMTEGYSTSKAALDMLTVIQSQRLKDKKIAVAAAHPGWVKTELGGEGATMEIADGASTVVTLATQPRATFPHAQLVHRGDRLPW